jgi:hypothetical protein
MLQPEGFETAVTFPPPGATFDKQDLLRELRRVATFVKDPHLRGLIADALLIRYIDDEHIERAYNDARTLAG